MLNTVILLSTWETNVLLPLPLAQQHTHRLAVERLAVSPLYEGHIRMNLTVSFLPPLATEVESLWQLVDSYRSPLRAHATFWFNSLLASVNISVSYSLILSFFGDILPYSYCTFWITSAELSYLTDNLRWFTLIKTAQLCSISDQYVQDIG